MENLPPLNFTLGTGVFTPTTRMSRREAREIRRQNYETLKRLRPDSFENATFSQSVFGTFTSIPQLFPSLLSIIQDVPAYIKIVLATEPKTLRGRHDHLQKQIYDNIRFRIMISKIPKGAFGYSDQPTNGLLDDYIAQAQKWFAIEQKVRIQMRRIVQAWLYKRYKDRMLNDKDPCTLEPITNPVRIFDVGARGYYQFDVKSLRRTIDFSLGFQDWMFPDPKFPRNPLTNLPFTEGQLSAILLGIRQAGLGSWLMEGFTKSNWNTEQFKLNYFTPLKLNAIHSLYKNPKSDQTQEFLEEFIEDQWEAHEMVRTNIKTILRWAIKHEMDDPYMQKWLDAWYEYFKLKVQYGIREASSDRLNAVFVKTLNLLENAQKIAEFAERRLVAIRGLNSTAPSNRQLPILPLQQLQQSTIRAFTTNPMFQFSFNVQAVENLVEEQSSEPESDTDQEELNFSTPEEVSAFLEFISTIFGETENASDPSQRNTEI